MLCLVGSQQRIEYDSHYRAPVCEGSESGSLCYSAQLYHAYGHGGEGFQSSWGTAIKLLHLIHEHQPSLYISAQLHHRVKPSFTARFGQAKNGVMERAGIKFVPIDGTCKSKL